MDSGVLDMGHLKKQEEKRKKKGGGSGRGEEEEKKEIEGVKENDVKKEK